jgi:hypothetical protein
MAIKWRRIRGTEYVARTGETRNLYTFYRWEALKRETSWETQDDNIQMDNM